MVNGLRHLEKTASEIFIIVKKHLARNIILSSANRTFIFDIHDKGFLICDGLIYHNHVHYFIMAVCKFSLLMCNNKP